jgi:hypothetical protein
MPTYAQNNTSLQSQAGSQLRTFDKTMTFTVTAYVLQTVSQTLAGPTATGNFDQRFEYTGAANSLYNNYLDAGIYTGSRMYSQDVIDSINSVMQRTVDQIESRITNRSISALLCHSSCHTSCHTSRGRR